MIKSANMPMDLILLLRIFFWAAIVHESEDTAYDSQYPEYNTKEGANKQVISSQADSLIKISRIWAD
ncbi:hypothetical protein ACWYVA_18250, partial [Klebsiella pneumoniae]